MKQKKNIIVGTNNFGLGPVGKISSIVNMLSDDFNWFACGNEFDLNIFDKNLFKDKLFTKDIKKIKDFVSKYNIKYAIVVLDVELSKILLQLGVKVVFVDSLPFMWTQADIEEGLLPLEATVYCAQKCVNVPNEAKKVLSQIKNLNWINPIQAISNSQYIPFKEPYVHINVGGLHSPIGNGESYINTVIIPLLRIFEKSNTKILITCGTKAKSAILDLVSKNNIRIDNIKILTLKQDEFLSSVKNSTIFLTSPGLTTIYEIFSINKPTIILPPQNLSQFYNVEYAKKILNDYKIIDWNTEKLNFKYLNNILNKGETFVVNEIYKYISELVGSGFEKTFEESVLKILFVIYF